MHIKNMVGADSVQQVKDVLAKTGVDYEKVSEGRVVLRRAPVDRITERLSQNLAEKGYVLHRGRKLVLCEKISRAIVEMVHDESNSGGLKLSDMLHNKLGYHYSYLSNTFSEVKGMTIKQFIIQYKIHKVMDLIMQDDLSLTEISYQMGYSSVAHLSTQFKKFTGVTPTSYRDLVRKG